MQRKGSASSAVAVPGAQCLGIQNFEWSYIPYKTDENEKAPFLKLAQSFLYPPVSHAIRSRSEEKTAGNIEGIAWKESNIQFSAFKRSFDGNGYILRVFENQGKAVDFILSVPNLCKVFLSDLEEKTGEAVKINNNTVTLSVKPYKVITIKLVL